MSDRYNTVIETMKKTLIVVFVVAFSIIVLSGCSQAENTNDAAVDQQGTEGTADTTTENAVPSNDKKTRFAKLQAELACDLAGAESGSDVTNAMSDFPALAEKYGFTEAELNTLNAKYENDEEMKKMASDEIKKLCPELIS